MNTFRACIISCFALALTACGVAEFFIKRTISNLEQKVASEIKQYAEFTPAQEQHIEQIAYGIASRVRAERLPLLVQHLELIANEIEQQQHISMESWRALTLFLESPIALSDKPEVIYSIADLVYDLTPEQRESTLAKVEEVYKKRLESLQESSAEERNDKLLKMTRNAFKELGLSRSRAQWKSARESLNERESYLPLELEAARRNHANFVAILSTPSESREAYRRAFLEVWKSAERPYRQSAPQIWQKNFVVSYAMVTRLLHGVDADEAQEAAYELREYAALLTQLSWTGSQDELAFVDVACRSRCW